MADSEERLLRGEGGGDGGLVEEKSAKTKKNVTMTTEHVSDCHSPEPKDPAVGEGEMLAITDAENSGEGDTHDRPKLPHLPHTYSC